MLGIHHTPHTAALHHHHLPPITPTPLLARMTEKGEEEQAQAQALVADTSKEHATAGQLDREVPINKNQPT